MLSTEFENAIIANSIDEIVHELLSGYVNEIQRAVIFANLVSNGVKEMGLSKANAAIDEKRIVGAGGGLGDSARGGMSELITGTNDKTAESILWVYRRLDGERRERGGRVWRNREILI